MGRSLDSQTLIKPRLNPIGVGFDPEKLVARCENGDPIEELVKQGSA